MINAADIIAAPMNALIMVSSENDGTVWDKRSPIGAAIRLYPTKLIHYIAQDTPPNP